MVFTFIFKKLNIVSYRRDIARLRRFQIRFSSFGCSATRHGITALSLLNLLRHKHQSCGVFKFNCNR
ncbi:Uncharacterised protein [Vibrio cholerae]|nr:Uncharacterised protein [Vibrio cholerae]